MIVTKIGKGSAPGHFGELMQGPVRKKDRVRIGLVTLVCDKLKSNVTFTPGEQELTVIPPYKTKTLKAAQIALQYFDHPDLGGTIEIENNFPKGSEGWGLGSSTSDSTASIRAVADSLNKKLSSKIIARLSFKAEGATDSIAFGNRGVLFASREGRVIEDFGEDIPLMDVLGFSTSQNGVNTLSVNPNYTEIDIKIFSNLIKKMKAGITTQNFDLCAEVATESAKLNQYFVPIKYFSFLLEHSFMKKIGAKGMIVSHSGTVAGFIFEPNKFVTLKSLEYIGKILSKEFNIKQVVAFRNWSA